jgi:uncharacterized protein (TIGR02246 family)
MSALGIYERLLTAWNSRDAKAYAALFAGDAAMVGFDGSQLAGAEVEAHGRPDLAEAHTAEIREVLGSA